MQDPILVERIEKACTLSRRLGLDGAEDAQILSAILTTIDADEYRSSAPTVRGLVSQALIYGDVVTRGLQDGPSSPAILLRTHSERVERFRECLSNLLEELRRPGLPSPIVRQEQPLDEGA